MTSVEGDAGHEAKAGLHARRVQVVLGDAGREGEANPLELDTYEEADRRGQLQARREGRGAVRGSRVDKDKVESGRCVLLLCPEVGRGQLRRPCEPM